MRSLRAGCLVLPCLLLPAAGCSRDMQYAFHAVTGQLNLVSRAVPVDRVLANGSLDEAQRAGLETILDVRRFAVDELGLNGNRNYTTYVDNGDQPVAWNLSAASKDSLSPYVWTFPFVGPIPYIGFFSFDEAKAYQQQLVGEYYDTILYPVESYSTLGLFPDPITSAMLGHTDIELSDLLIHELTHGTIWSNADRDYNENVATFVGRIGAIRYLSQRYGEDSEIVKSALDRYHDMELHNDFLSQLRRRLEDFYASDLPREEKIAGRDAIFDDAHRQFREEIQPQMVHPELYDWVHDLKFNNAWILLNARYNRSIADFQAVYDSVGGDFAQALRIFSDAAATTDPIAYLRSIAGIAP
jgi:predicted aminopeptidase